MPPSRLRTSSHRPRERKEIHTPTLVVTVMSSTTMTLRQPASMSVRVCTDTSRTREEHRETLRAYLAWKAKYSQLPASARRSAPAEA